MPRGGRSKRKSTNDVESSMTRALDELRKYDEWRSTILPQLETLIQQGATADSIFEWAETYAAAEMTSLALTETDPKVRLTALKDVLDRKLGKATERHEHKHKYESLKDEELDALLESRLKEVADGDRSEH